MKTLSNKKAFQDAHDNVVRMHSCHRVLELESSYISCSKNVIVKNCTQVIEFVIAIIKNI